MSGKDLCIEAIIILYLTTTYTWIMVLIDLFVNNYGFKY